jgi:hypothetical protein
VPFLIPNRKILIIIFLTLCIPNINIIIGGKNLFMRPHTNFKEDMIMLIIPSSIIAVGTVK